ncbi:protein phosphatase 2C domain-containing protein [Metabacillus sp. KIGAM252]|uniref:Protein phosphatase 2C domain-containing protein n=1 Tax=Metabacillus flavus TaxID=2823519 RepID=A0ABS5LER5_9BACI|nr:protein phosphatase 2C domain-containing protein [Metabacillus flavus]MBS2969238.1 protein phosphatase 2C domain-containing protein [Metabacillus flavus]
MNISLLSHKSPSKIEIEDAFFISDDCQTFGVFDGVTPMNGMLFANGHNGAFLASHMLASTLGLPLYKDKSLIEWLVESNALLLQRMESAAVKIEDRHLRWASCAAVLRIDGGRAAFVQCGDCMILKEDFNGLVTPLTVNSVEGISERARHFRESKRAEGLAIPPESWFLDHPHERMKDHRQLANRSGGYSVVNGDRELIDFIQAGEADLKDIKSLLLISDGFFHPEWSLQEVHKEISKIGLESYAEALRYMEHMNGLQHDDMTGIYIQF